ncbi:MAG: DUF6160 family protein [Pseudomonadota bacterium]
MSINLSMKAMTGAALIGLPMAASAHLTEMNDQEMSAVSGQLGIIDLTTLGVDIELGPLGAPLFGLPFTLGSAKIGLPGFTGASYVSFAPSIGPSLLDFQLTNLGPTLTPFGLKIGLFDLPGAIGPAIIDPIDLELTNFGPTLTPFGLKIGLFDAVPAIGPAIIDGPDLAFKGTVLGGSVLAGALGAVVLSGALTGPATP